MLDVSEMSAVLTPFEKNLRTGTAFFLFSRNNQAAAGPMHLQLSAGEIGCGPPTFEGAFCTAVSCTASHFMYVCLGILLAKQTVVERGWLYFSLKMQLGVYRILRVASFRGSECFPR